MNTLANMPEAVRNTIRTFESLIASDQKRRQELEAEISALSLRQRVIAATQDASWITRCFIEPRVSELRAIEARLTLVGEKLAQLRATWVQATAPAASPVPAPISATASAPASTRAPAPRWFETGSPAVICLAA